MVLLGALLPWGGSILSITGLNPLTRLDLPGIAFTLTGVIFAYNLRRGRLLDLVPIVRSTLIENMADGVLALDMQNRIVDINPAAQRVLAPSADSLIGVPVESLLERFPRAVELFNGVFEAHTELTLEGTYFDVQITPLYDRRKRLSGRLITWHDITDRKRVEMEHEQLIADLDAYAHMVAHDLKNPVSILIGFTELLLEPDALTKYPNAPNWFREINHTSYKLLNIIDELLILASLRKNSAVKTSPLNMAQIVEEALGRVSNLTKQFNAEIIQPVEWVSALGYAPWVEEVWVNYLSNAIKYGGTPPRIELGAQHMPDGCVCFWVQDNGNGLTSEEQAKLFQAFERLGQTRARGHGLGLSIVQRIMEKLNGSVGVESEVGKGSRFYFILPAA